MKKLTIKAGRPIKFISDKPTVPIKLIAGFSRANPNPKIIILKGNKII